jgi:hypothetical protein
MNKHKGTAAKRLSDVQTGIRHEQALSLVFRQSSARFIHGVQDSLCEAHDRSKSGAELQWTDYLALYRMLPDLALKRQGFEHCLTNLGQISGYEKFMTQYGTIADWLEYLNPGDKPIPSELMFSSKVKEKPRADLSMSVLNLAVELLPRCPEFQERHSTPASVWFAWEVAALDGALMANGLATGQPAKAALKSKDAAYKGLRDAANWLESADQLVVSSGQELTDMVDALPIFAAICAKDDPTFRRSSAYKEFHSNLSKMGRAIRQHGTATSFMNGAELPSGRSAPRTSKGFA